MSKFFLIFFASLLFSSPMTAKDDLGEIIENEQREKEEWMASDEELPPVFLLGDQSSVELYSHSTYRGKSYALCSPAQFDEWIQLSGKSKGGKSWKLNMNLPRMREEVAQTCLIRPGDPFFSIGAKAIEAVEAKHFFIAREKTVCSKRSSYVLKAKTSKQINPDPFFYSTDSKLLPGPLDYTPVEELDTVSFSPVWSQRLDGQVPFLDEYKTTIYKSTATNFDHLIRLVKKEISIDDVDLPNEIIFSERQGQVQVLLSGKVKKRSKSGHVDILGVFDFNRDGLTDVLLKGDRNGCAFVSLFKGGPEGLSLLKTPNKSCSCH